jgi:hypothetical protein
MIFLCAKAFALIMGHVRPVGGSLYIVLCIIKNTGGSRNMDFTESLLVALFTITVVFVVLCGLYIILEIFSRVFTAAGRTKPSGGGSPNP